MLRFGLFYAPDSAHTEDQVGAARRGIGAVVGDPDAFQSMIHADDAAAAVVAALGVPAGTYNVVESTSRRRSDRSPRRSAQPSGGRPAPSSRERRRSSPGRRRRPSLDPSGCRTDASSRPTGWEPAFPSVRAGMPAVVASMPAPPRPPLLERLVRPAAALLAVSAVSLGLWAIVDPASFYETFPFGRGWVAADGPYNEHLIRDFGSLHLGLAVLYGAAVLWPERRWVRVAALAALVDGVPHLAYHALNLDPYETTDAVATIVALLFGLLPPVVMILGTATQPEPRRDARLTAPPAPAATR